MKLLRHALMEYSGTGLLTGVIIIESASGQKLDSTKGCFATKEVVVTGDLAQQVGNDNATISSIRQSFRSLAIISRTQMKFIIL